MLAVSLLTSIFASSRAQLFLPRATADKVYHDAIAEVDPVGECRPKVDKSRAMRLANRVVAISLRVDS